MRRVPRCIATAASIFAIASATTTAVADEAKAAPGPGSTRSPSGASSYSRYELESIAQALARIGNGSALDPSPQGKLVEGVEVIPLDVFEKRDPIPNVLDPIVNWFHSTTRPYIIEREVLLARGERYSQALADETARNLRNLPQLSLVLVLPLRGSKPDRVRILVLTKDVWSLRLNSDFRAGSGGLEYLLLQPSEENLFGRHQQIQGTFQLYPATYTLGVGYTIPRVAGSRIALNADANIIVNRQPATTIAIDRQTGLPLRVTRNSGKPEGSFGSFTYGQPLWSTKAEWAWQGSISWRYEIARRYIGTSIRTYDAKTRAGDALIPWIYTSDVVGGYYQVTRSWGQVIKQDVTAGVSASRQIYRPQGLDAFSPAAGAVFVAHAMPVSDVAIGPFVQYHTYSTRFLTSLDFNTLGLQEDYRIGHDLYVRVSPVSKAFGASRDYVEIFAAGSYSVPLGDGMARGFVESDTEIARDDLPDAYIHAGGRIASPRTPIGRVHVDAHVLHRYRNYLNDQSVIGGDTRPRGYPSSAFIGKDVVAASLELRSRPVEVFTLQLAGAAFFDTGDAFNGFQNMALKKSAGFGLRFLFPQLDRVVMRVDWGFPLTPGVVPSGGFPGAIFVTFSQAFAMPTVPSKL